MIIRGVLVIFAGAILLFPIALFFAVVRSISGCVLGFINTFCGIYTDFFSSLFKAAREAGANSDGERSCDSPPRWEYQQRINRIVERAKQSKQVH